MSEMCVTRTPLRISFLGGGSDLPLYTDTGNVGKVVSATIDKYVYVWARRRQDDQINVRYRENEWVKDIGKLNNEYVREALKWVKWKGGIEICSSGDVLLTETGLGGSSAFLVGLLTALYDLKLDILYSPFYVAEEAFRLETGPLGKKVGRQDHYAAAYGGLRYYEFRGGENVSQTSFSVDGLRNHSSNLLLIHTAQNRSDTKEIFSDIYDPENAERTLRSLHILSMLTNRGIESLAMEEYPSFFGLMDDAWEAKKGLSPRVSSLTIDDVRKKVMNAGAMAAKLLGAGGGGYILAWCPEGKEAVIKNLHGEFEELPFSFVTHGAEVLFSR